MKFYEVQPYLESGKKIRRRSFTSSDLYLYFENDTIYIHYSSGVCDRASVYSEDLLADDWEIIEEEIEVKLRIKEYFTCPSCNHDNIGFNLDDGISKCEACGQKVKTLSRCNRNGIEILKRYKAWLEFEIITKKTIVQLYEECTNLKQVSDYQGITDVYTSCLDKLKEFECDKNGSTPKE